MKLVLDIIGQFDVERMICDKNYFVLEMMELANRHGIPVEVYRQNAENMARAYDVTWSVVSSQRAHHGGETGLREHVLNAAQEPTAYGPRLTKIEESRKIDAAVALVMVTFVAEQQWQESAGQTAWASTW
jgi:phage terminase large subunit-like protein